MKFEQFYSLLDAVLVVTEGAEDLVSPLRYNNWLSYTLLHPNITFTNKPCPVTPRPNTHILSAALSTQINRFYLSEKLPTNVISFVIVVCDKLGDIVVSLS